MSTARAKHPQIGHALGCVRAALDRLPDAGYGARMHVAVSGGPDSVCALALLELARHERGLELSVGHVDHGLRAASREEADFVRGWARVMGLAFVGHELQLTPGPGLPARARDARRAALQSGRDATEAQWLVLGHTATDQVETVLMHLTRGAGLDGLSGMPETEGCLFRPLLGLTREQTRAVCERMGLRFFEDPSNERREHFRSELRHEVLPRLRARNPALEAAVLGSTRALRAAEAALSQWVEREHEARRSAQGRHDLRDYAALPLAVRTAWLRRLLVGEGVSASELRRRSIEAIDDALMGDLRRGRGVAPRAWDLPGGWRVRVRNGQIWARKGPKDTDDHL